MTDRASLTVSLTEALYEIVLAVRQHTPNEVRAADSTVELEENPMPSLTNSLDEKASMSTWLGWGDEGPTNTVVLALSGMHCRPVWLHMWRIQQPHNSNYHYVIAQVDTELETFLCGGMTDYSGGGGSNLQRLHKIFSLVSSIVGIPYTNSKLSPEWNDRVRTFVNHQYEARRQETNANAQPI